MYLLEYKSTQQRCLGIFLASPFDTGLQCMESRMTPEIIQDRELLDLHPPPLTPTDAQLTGQVTSSGNQGQGQENTFRRTLVKSPSSAVLSHYRGLEGRAV